MGVKSAKRIIAARKNGPLDFDALKRIGVVLKRAIYFITCSGRMMYPVKIEEDYICSHLIGDEKKKVWDISSTGTYRQISLFDDMSVPALTAAGGL
jgi:predicted DNA-binding helix-hairpin-helix protein